MRTVSNCPLVIPSLLFAVVIGASGCGRTAAPLAASPPVRSELSQQAADDIAQQFATTLSRQRGVPLDRLGNTTVGAIAEGNLRGVVAGRENTADEGAFSWSFSIAFFDAQGNPQPMFIAGSTSSMRVVARAHGRTTAAEHQAEVGVYRSLDVLGLLPAETTLEIDGAANDTADCSFAASNGSETRRYHLLGAGALTDVRKLKDESVNPYPLSGTARWEVAADAFVQDANGTKEAHYEATVVVTFNGTQHPTIEINRRYRYQTNLDTGEIARQPS